MQEKIELNRVRNFNEIIEDSIQYFKQNWKPLLKSYFIICGFFWLTSLIVSIYNLNLTLEHTAKGESVFTLTYFLALLFEMFNYLIITLTILCFIALYKEKGNEPPTVEEVWIYVKYYFFRIFGSYLCLGALIAAGIVCCVIPGLYFAVVFSLTFPIMIMENSTLGYAFNRSFKLIKSHWWFTLGVAVITEIIIAVAMIGIVIPVMLVTLAATTLSLVSATGVYSYASVIASHLLQFLYVLPLIGITLTYFSLTEAKDDGTLYERIMMIGKTGPDKIETLTEEY